MEEEKEKVIQKAIDFILGMKPGQVRNFPERLSSEDRKRVLNGLRRSGLPRVRIGMNPTSEGGGMTIYRPDKMRGRR